MPISNHNYYFAYIKKLPEEDLRELFLSWSNGSDCGRYIEFQIEIVLISERDFIVIVCNHEGVIADQTGSEAGTVHKEFEADSVESGKIAAIESGKQSL